MTVGDVLDGSFRGVRAALGPVALLVLLLEAPLLLLTNLLLWLAVPGITGAFGAVDPSFSAVDLGQLFGGGILLTVLGAVVRAVAAAAIVDAVLTVDRGRRADVWASLRAGLRRAPTVVGATVVVWIVGLLGLAALVAIGVALFAASGEAVVAVLGVLVLLPIGLAGGLVFAAVSSLLAPIAVLEGRGVVGTLGRALWVLRVRFWRVLGITLLIAVLVGLVTAGLQLPFVVVSVVAGGAGWVVESLGGIVAAVLAVPVAAVAALLVLLDARIRVEGYDLQVRSRGLG